MEIKYTEEKAKNEGKYKRAAYKAWRKIREEKRSKAAKGNRQLAEFVIPEKVTSLIHPEITLAKKVQTATTSFGKNIISLFHKTPADIACGPFWELRWAFGCPLDCNYCYLRGTMRGNMRQSIIKLDYVHNALEEAFQQIKEPAIFNAGELSDSLMNPNVMAQIADKFETQNKHKLALLSKFGPKNVQFLTEKPRKQVICAWSINAIEVARRWEKAAAHPEKRIEAAKLVSEAGYDTRIRIDPMFPIENWKSHYEDIVYRIFEAFEPRRIILGTPRGLWKTIKYAEKAGVDMSWTDYFKEDSGWGKKLSFGKRLEMYQFMFDKLNSLGYKKERISLCKETRSVWKSLALPYTPITCNCYSSKAFN
ncbi:MAG TPA: radical SAM protein [Nitrososphaerales archaeon]